MAPSPFISRTNPAVTPFVSMPSAQQPRGTLPAPPRSALEAALSRPFVMDVATARLLADARAFTARAEMDMVMGPPNARTTNTVPLVVAFLEGRMRMDMDVNEVRSSTIPAPMFTALIELDLNKVVSVVRPDRRVLHVMYPDLRGYIDFPLTPEEVAGTMKVERTQAGRGTALGESCAMQRVVVTCESTNRHEATVWLSDAQRGFPVHLLEVHRCRFADADREPAEERTCSDAPEPVSDPSYHHANFTLLIRSPVDTRDRARHNRRHRSRQGPRARNRDGSPRQPGPG